MTTRSVPRSLPTRILGRLEVPAVGFGAMVLSPGMYGEVDEDGALRAIAAALDVGCTFLDTSDGYGPDGHNERLVGRAVRGRRDEVVVATKFGFRVPAGAERHRDRPHHASAASCLHATGAHNAEVEPARTPTWCAYHRGGEQYDVVIPTAS